jgi:signal transduction histidine kinase
LAIFGVETNLYRIAQEALNNIAKHAQANHAAVILERREDCILLVLEDNGIGLDLMEGATPAESGKGLGIIGMRERAALCGGTLEIESSPGGGVTIFVQIPVLSGDEKERESEGS